MIRECLAVDFEESDAMNGENIHWILCPKCQGKTRTQIREDTVLENFPLFCPKCKQTFLVSVRKGRTRYLSVSDNSDN